MSWRYSTKSSSKLNRGNSILVVGATHELKLLIRPSDRDSVRNGLEVTQLLGFAVTLEGLVVDFRYPSLCVYGEDYERNRRSKSIL